MLIQIIQVFAVRVLIVVFMRIWTMVPPFALTAKKQHYMPQISLRAYSSIITELKYEA